MNVQIYCDWYRRLEPKKSAFWKSIGVYVTTQPHGNDLCMHKLLLTRHIQPDKPNTL
jgi:hypothetical protein